MTPDINFLTNAYLSLILSIFTFIVGGVFLYAVHGVVEAFHDLFGSLHVSLEVTRKPGKRSFQGSAKNNVMNAAVDFQKIETADIEIPVIAARVLTYGPGELGPTYPKKTRLYYSPEALKTKDFLDTVRRSAIQVKTHEKNTEEANRSVDGWPAEAWWDEKEKRVKVKGVLHGEDNVAYVKANKDKPTFGTSAYIGFIKVDRESGVSPEGEEYDAIVREATNNHIAILPNIRDPKNVILAVNALGDKVDDAANSTNEKPNGEEKVMNQEEFDKMADARDARNKAAEDLKNNIKNEVLEEIEKKKESENAGKNEGDKETKKEEEIVKNEDDKETKKEDDATASNAMPSEAMVKDFSDALQITFKKTPTFKELCDYAGITATNTFDQVKALNAKRVEFKNGVSEVEAKNGVTSAKTVDEVLREM